MIIHEQKIRHAGRASLLPSYNTHSEDEAWWPVACQESLFRLQNSRLERRKLRKINFIPLPEHRLIDAMSCYLQKNKSWL